MVAFSGDSIITCFIKDPVQINVNYKDTAAIGGALPSVQMLYFNWNGDSSKLTDSIAVTGKDSVVIIKSFKTAQNTFVYVKARDNDNEPSRLAKIRLLIKGTKIVITKLVPITDSVLVGDTVTLRVSAKDSGTSGAIQNFIWTVNGVDSTSRDSVFKVAFTSPGSQLVFVKVMSSDSIYSATDTVRIRDTLRFDSTGPVIKFISPVADSVTVNTSTIPVVVQTMDSSGISYVVIANHNATLMPNWTTILNQWKDDSVQLNEGPNTIQVIAWDESNNPHPNQSTKSITVNYVKKDTTPPVVLFTFPPQNDTLYQSSTAVVVSVTDQSGVAWVKINGDSITNISGSSYSANVVLTKGKNNIVVSTADKAGNNVAVTQTVYFAVRDTIPPTMRIVSPQAGKQIVATNVLVTVSATDTGTYASGIDSVVIKGIRATVVDGSYVRTVQLKHGYDTIRVVAWDASANHNFTNDSVIVIQNVPPHFVPDSLEKDTSLLVNRSATIPICASDADSGDIVSYFFISLPKSSTNPQIGVNGGCAAISNYTPESLGIDTFTVKVTDNYNAADTLHLRVNVTSTSKPTFITDSAKIPDTAFLGKLYSIQLKASDLNGNPLTYSLGPKVPVGAKIDSTGKVSWTPGMTDTGKKEFKAFVNNSSGTDSIHWTVTVLIPSAPPHLNNPGNKTINELQLLKFTLSATDSNNDLLVYSFKSMLPSVATLDSSSGVFNWTPTAKDAGIYPIMFKVNAKNRSSNLSDSVTDTITVNKVNLPPIFISPTPGNKTAYESQPLTFNLQASDSNGDSIIFSMVGAPAGAALANGKTFAWTPTSSQGGTTYQVTFYATDYSVPLMKDSVKITISVLDTTKPVFNSHSKIDTVYFGNVYQTTVTANDADGDQLTYSISNGPGNISVNSTSGSVTMTPTAVQDNQLINVSVIAVDNAKNSATLMWQIQVLPKWQRTFGGTVSQDTGFSVVQTTDGGYALCGTSTASSKSPLFIRTDAQGNTLQFKHIGSSGSNASACAMQQTTDGGFIFCGTDSSSAASKLLLIKTNGNGDTTWTSRLGQNSGGIGTASTSEKGMSVCQTSDGGYISCGVSYHRSGGIGATVPDKMYVVKVTATGTKEWDKVYGPLTGNAAGYSILQVASDNGYIVCGQVDGKNSLVSYVYLVRTASNGDSTWTRAYQQGQSNVAGLTVQQTTGGFVVGGVSSSPLMNQNNGFVMKVGTFGDSLWTLSTGMNTSIASVKASGTGDFIACGSTTAGGPNVLLYRFTTNGKMTWSTTPGSSLNSGGESVFPTKDNGFIVTGFTALAGSGYTGVYLVKTDGSGIISK